MVSLFPPDPGICIAFSYSFKAITYKNIKFFFKRFFIWLGVGGRVHEQFTDISTAIWTVNLSTELDCKKFINDAVILNSDSQVAIQWIKCVTSSDKSRHMNLHDLLMEKVIDFEQRFSMFFDSRISKMSEISRWSTYLCGAKLIKNVGYYFCSVNIL